MFIDYLRKKLTGWQEKHEATPDEPPCGSGGIAEHDLEVEAPQEIFEEVLITPETPFSAPLEQRPGEAVGDDDDLLEDDDYLLEDDDELLEDDDELLEDDDDLLEDDDDLIVFKEELPEKGGDSPTSDIGLGLYNSIEKRSESTIMNDKIESLLDDFFAAPETHPSQRDNSFSDLKIDVLPLKRRIEALERQEDMFKARLKYKDSQIDHLQKTKDLHVVKEATKIAFYGPESVSRGCIDPWSRISHIFDRLREIEKSMQMIDPEKLGHADEIFGYIEDILWPDEASEVEPPLLSALRFRLVENDARIAYLREVVLAAIRENDKTKQEISTTKWFEQNGGYTLAMAQNIQLVEVMLRVMDESEVLDQPPNERHIRDYLKQNDLPITLREVGKMSPRDVLSISGIGYARLHNTVFQVEETGILTPLTLNNSVLNRYVSSRELALSSVEILSRSPYSDRDLRYRHDTRSVSPQELLCELMTATLKRIDLSMPSKFSGKFRN